MLVVSAYSIHRLIARCYVVIIAMTSLVAMCQTLKFLSFLHVHICRHVKKTEISVYHSPLW